MGHARLTDLGRDFPRRLTDYCPAQAGGGTWLIIDGGGLVFTNTLEVCLFRDVAKVADKYTGLIYLSA
jgi:hypothetical protein